jgi:hypothetical protein
MPIGSDLEAMTVCNVWLGIYLWRRAFPVMFLDATVARISFSSTRRRAGCSRVIWTESVVGAE